MTSPPPHPRVTPARLSFLAIYNPTLGPTDETFADQLVFWYSRAAAESRTAHRKRGDGPSTIAKRNGKAKATGEVKDAGHREESKSGRDGELQEEENERLRQIGLAQGMVHFARTFSNGEPVDSVETEKSRIVLKELEEGWWVLASIDLTRLPSTPDTSILSTTKAAGDEKKPQVEYSSREVSPPLLLIQQLIQAHHMFSLHHGFSLDEMFVKLSRDRFCSALGRYWNRFARSWDVLLHGNPAVDVLGGLKLASGGELGFGVGEEEWGSGEREVLEDVVHRTEGLVDMVVARYGEPLPSAKKQASTYEQTDALPWLGSGDTPTASDGVFFSGVGAVDRPTLRNIAFWMQQVYTQGEYAYGVHDNPSRERRRTRRRPVNTSNGGGMSTKQNETETPKEDAQPAGTKEQGKAVSEPPPSQQDTRPRVSDRVASYDHASAKSPAPSADRPGIPPPIVSAAEQALEKATAGVKKAPATEPPRSDDSGTTMGIPDQYMKYMTFGLSTLAKSYSSKPPEVRTDSPDSSTTLKATDSGRTLRSSAKDDLSTNDDEEAAMSQVDPIPDGDALKAKLARQIRQENKGYFLIGYTGELDVEHDVDEEDLTDGSVYDDSGGSRTVLRTVHVNLAAAPPPPAPDPEPTSREPERGRTGMPSRQSSSQSSSKQPSKRLRVLLYVHRPFMYAFLFEQRADVLGYTAFYKSLHRNLQPIHKPLLTSTNPRKVAQRIETSQLDAAETASLASNRTVSKATTTETSPIYDLLYDPLRLTVHTSIPDIPAPGTSAAEGLGPSGRVSAAPWTRLDALNVHSQILSTYASTVGKKGELERTSKTTRGWWVVWLRLPPSSPGDTSVTTATPPQQSQLLQPPSQRRPSNADTSRTPTHVPAPVIRDTHRIAFLVRRANDATNSVKASTGSRVASGMWSSLALRSGPSVEEKTGGAGAGWGPAALAGGIGVDARKYVEGLLSLNR